MDVWVEEWSEKYSQPYWYNEKTKESVWEKPQELKNNDRKKRDYVKRERDYKNYNNKKSKPKVEWKQLTGPEREARDAEVLKFASIVVETAKNKREYETPDPRKEILRYKITNKLRTYLDELCNTYSVRPPSYSFERWLLSQRLVDSEAVDPLLPSETSVINLGLVHEFERVGISTEDSMKICKDLAEECAKQITTLADDPTEQTLDEAETVQIKEHRDEMILTFQNQSFPINIKHYEKLKRLYKDNEESLFLPRLFCLLARYSALDGAGYQAALPERVFEGLNKHLSISHEGFASPLNCFYESFGSAFYDTDKYFGSKGSFFQFEPTSGYYEVNPPFVEEVMVAMALHIENLLNKNAHEALGFVIIVPGWTDIPSYDIVKKSKFLREELILQPYEHYYMEGFQHNMKRQEKKAQCVTFVFFMQTDSMKPVSKEVMTHVNRYFRV